MAEDTEKLNLREIARKKRHIHLVEKLQKGQTLSKKEIDELGEYENEVKKTGKPWIVDTQKEFAEAIGVTTRRVRYMKRSGMPVEEDGRYNVVLIERWRHREQYDQSGWDDKQKELKYKMSEVKYKQLTGELVNLAQVEAEWISIAIAFKTALLALPSYIAPKLAMMQPREIAEILREHLTDILKQLSGQEDDHAG
ncbi:MAG: hypothetical protein RBU23_13170 [Candidatus Auribacterota bacterium]|jgi:phage terminase Nu1 subunit (DNA packaging protein)|nr:hypothetical protein [Candidatus Auribacterota bacterium]